MILITGATGTVGRQIVAQLRARGETVRAMTRNPSAAAFPDGVEVVRGDLADPAGLGPALREIRAVFLVWPFTDPDRTAVLAPRVIATLAARGQRIVYLSASAADDPASFWARVEQAIVQSGAPHTILRPTGFAKNTLMWAPQIQSGDVVRWPYGEAARSLIHEADIAAVAARALTEAGHDGATYLLSGPAAITQAAQVRAIGEVLGRRVFWKELPAAEARAQLIETFGNAAFVDAALPVWASFIAHPEPVTATVERVTGRPARSFAQWAAEHAAEFRRSGV